jgi:hypothetical protein
MEFTFDGNRYKIDKLNAEQQFYIVKRLLPVMKSFAPLIEKAGEAMRNLPPNADRSQMTLDIDEAEQLAMVFDAIENLSDDNAKFIINTCLHAVKRVVQTPEGERLQPIMTASGHLMFQELDDLASYVYIVWEVLSNNLANFSFDKLPFFQNMAKSSTVPTPNRIM